MSAEILFPWPGEELSPNWRGHWAKKAKAVKAYRKLCWALAYEAHIHVVWDGPIHLWITFHPPSKRTYDDDNCLSRFKAGRDGLADALRINDKRFISHPLVSTAHKGGQVRVRLSRGPE